MDERMSDKRLAEIEADLLAYRIKNPAALAQPLLQALKAERKETDRLRFLCSSDLRTHTDTDLDDDVLELQELAWRLMSDERLEQLLLLLDNDSWRGVNVLPTELLQALKAEREEVERLRSKLTTQEIAEGRAADLEYEPPDTLDQQGWDVLDKALAEAQQGRPEEKSDE